MKSDSGQTTSIWMATSQEIPSDGALATDTSADVCIVGAGIAGMTTAYLLARERMKGSSKLSTANRRASRRTSNRKRPGAIRTAANQPAASKAATKTNKRSRTNKADTALERRATEKKRDVKVGAVHTRAHFDDPKGLSS